MFAFTRLDLLEVAKIVFCQKRTCEKEKLVQLVAEGASVRVAVHAHAGHVPRPPVAVDEAPLALNVHDGPRVAEAVAVQRHARSVPGALAHSADDLHVQSCVTAVYMQEHKFCKVYRN